MEAINQYIEQTVLKPNIIDKDIYTIVEEAKQHQFNGICVPPFWVKKAKRELGNANINVVTVVGFPLGYNMTETKIEEIKKAIDDGANELDLVMNISAFKANMPWVKIEIAKCAGLAHKNNALLKVIIETAFLNDEEIEKACLIAQHAGADFLKTSTGFAPSGAQVGQVKLMRQVLSPHVGIKASGGITTLEQAKVFIDAGADRIGTSSGCEIMKQATL
ncbi:MAG: deoxyribose-phosphate aldolase [Bacteroidota bacterium]|nr:deoxyribose-phosphate aldolase [Bacteroidota bacterium]